MKIEDFKKDKYSALDGQTKTVWTDGLTSFIAKPDGMTIAGSLTLDTDEDWANFVHMAATAWKERCDLQPRLVNLNGVEL